MLNNTVPQALTIPATLRRLEPFFCASGGELVQVSSPQLEPITYRNFNLCPHCVFHGEQSLLCRLCEGIPMISRSDGKTFHLLLADYPARYPAERA